MGQSSFGNPQGALPARTGSTWSPRVIVLLETWVKTISHFRRFLGGRKDYILSY